LLPVAHGAEREAEARCKVALVDAKSAPDRAHVGVVRHAHAMDPCRDTLAPGKCQCVLQALDNFVADVTAVRLTVE